MFEKEFEELELTDEQKLMLLPADLRIKTLQYPSATKARVDSLRIAIRKGQRKGRWASKLSKSMTGKGKKRWGQIIKKHGKEKDREKIQDELGPKFPKAKAKARAKQLKGAASANANAKAKKEAEEVVWQEVQESPWKNQSIRVVSDEAGRDLVGRKGQVISVHQRKGEGEESLVQLAVLEDTDQANVFRVLARFCDNRANEPKISLAPAYLNYNKFKGAARQAAATAVNAEKEPEQLELVQYEKLVEMLTIKAAIMEIDSRFQMESVLNIEPSVALILSQAEGVPEDHGGEHKAFLAKVNTSKLIQFCIWSSPPAHYTFLSLKAVGKSYAVKYKDSLVQTSQPGFQCWRRWRKPSSPQPSAPSALQRCKEPKAAPSAWASTQRLARIGSSTSASSERPSLGYKALPGKRSPRRARRSRRAICTPGLTSRRHTRRGSRSTGLTR